jgi:putative membrane protein (TIGR04086 family)
VARHYENSDLKERLKPVGISLICGIVVSVILLFVFALWITFNDTPQRIIDPLAIFALSAGAFAAGFVCTRIVRRKGVIYGAVCGLCLSVLVILAGFFTGAGGIGVAGLFRVIFVMLCAMIGGVSGVNVRKKRR